MLISRLDLSLPYSTQSSIRRGTDGTLGVVVDIVEAAFVEGVSAEEVDGGEI